MTIKLIGIRQFAQNLSKLLQEAQEKNVHFVVMRHGTPVANVYPAKQPITDADVEAEGIDVEDLKKDIAEAREEIARGEVYTTEEVRRMLGLSSSNGHRKRPNSSRSSRRRSAAGSLQK